MMDQMLFDMLFGGIGGDEQINQIGEIEKDNDTKNKVKLEDEKLRRLQDNELKLDETQDIEVKEKDNKVKDNKNNKDKLRFQ